MEKKHYLTLDIEFLEFCKINKIDNIELFAKQTFTKGFTIMKYGEVPMTNGFLEKIVHTNDEQIEKLKKEIDRLKEKLNEYEKQEKPKNNNLYDE
jgi:tRNA(Phe) wybutosine-synthesizing methylase Tyw3